MPKIKHTKSELKNQRDDLRRYERFLPTLELKKQQLQIEVRKLNAALEASR
ncbi:MAG: V-type ATP synthase subunit D, partial [Kiritimatiellae bacterium]|nr:V-type ATP synthase subunit D [Kiritimatiellia bacterium]